MSFRTKREIRFFARPAWLVILTGLVFSVGYIDYLLVSRKIPIDIQILICAILASALAICNIVVHFIGFHEKLFAKIKITNDKIIWHCILKKKHTIRRHAAGHRRHRLRPEDLALGRRRNAARPVARLDLSILEYFRPFFSSRMRVFMA